jgi:hypothetical protein
MKTSELTGAALDWAVALIEFPSPDYEDDNRLVYVHGDDEFHFAPSIYWTQGGPIIEREGMNLRGATSLEKMRWHCRNMECSGQRICSDTVQRHLIAAMRCYVASQLGDEVEVPEELKGVKA